MTPRTRLAAAVLALTATAAGAADLLQVWEAARQHDPQGAVFQASRAAGAARREQAAALWRPSVGLTASAGWSGAQSEVGGAQFSAPGFGQSSGVAFNTSVNGGTASRWAISARQPIYNPERQAQREQLNISADATELEWKNALQDWMLQTTQRYFDLVLAERRLLLLKEQLVAVEKARTEARDRFTLGDAPVTDTHEATARARGLQAQVLAASNELELARNVLADVTGLPPASLQAQAPRADSASSSVATLEHWLALASQDNLLLRLQQAQALAAGQEVHKHRLTGSATVDLVAQAGRERLSGNGDFGSASNAQRQQMVGIAVSVPLYTGGWRNAKLEESLRLEEKARAEVERTRQQVTQMTRSAWLSLQSAAARVDALDAARTASQARLAATRLGRQVGDRTTLDLLNAQSDASAAEFALLQARVDILQNRLRLDALAGQLGEKSLQQASATLQP